MKAKFLFVFSLFLFIGNQLFSQLQIENTDKLDLLKASETIFVYRQSDDIKALKEIFKNNWNLSKVTMQSLEEFEEKKYQVGKSYMMATTITSIDNNFTMLNFELWLVTNDKKNRFIRFGNWQLYAAAETVSDLRNISFGDDKTEHGVFLKYFYEDAKCVEYNWSPGQIKNTLLWWEQNLLSAKKPNPSKPSKIIDPQLSELTSKTLYIPNYVTNKLVVKINTNKNDNSQKTPIAELMADYPYKYQMVTPSELSDLILSSEEPIFYLTVAARDIAFYTSIIRSTDGQELFYECLLANKSHFKPDHFEKIGDYIKSSAGKKK